MRNALNLTIFGTNYSFKKLRLPVNKTDWVSHGRPAVVNAYYSPLENSIRKCLVLCAVAYVRMNNSQINFIFFFIDQPQSSQLVSCKVLSSARTVRLT